MKMWVYIIRRCLLLIPVIIGVMTITFILTSQLPIDDRLISAIGFSKNGYSPTIPCAEINAGNGTCPHPASSSLALTLLLATPNGNYSAVYRNRPMDQGARVMLFSGFALPGFLLA